MLQLDNIHYEHRQANFIEAKTHALKLVGLLKNSLKVNDGNVDLDIGNILSNIGSPEMQSIESFILKYVTATNEHGEMIKLSTLVDINAHFNHYRSHYFSLMLDGLKFHFADFLPGGVVSAANTNLSALIAK